MNKEQHFYREDYYPVSPGMFLVCQENKPEITTDITNLSKRDLLQELARTMDCLEAISDQNTYINDCINRWKNGRK